MWALPSSIPLRKACIAAVCSVVSVIGGRSREWVIFEEELRELGEVLVCTDDGSYGRKGL